MKWTPKRLRELGTLLGFIFGRRLPLVLLLAAVSAACLTSALWFEDDYWAPLLLKTAVGCGFLALLQVLPDPRASPGSRVLLSIAAIALLVAGHVYDSPRELLIEIGSTIMLYLTLEAYLQHRLDEARVLEKQRAIQLAADVLFEVSVDLPARLSGYEIPAPSQEPNPPLIRRAPEFEPATLSGSSIPNWSALADSQSLAKQLSEAVSQQIIEPLPRGAYLLSLSAILKPQSVVADDESTAAKAPLDWQTAQSPEPQSVERRPTPTLTLDPPQNFEPVTNLSADSTRKVPPPGF